MVAVCESDEDSVTFIRVCHSEMMSDKGYFYGPYIQPKETEKSQLLVDSLVSYWRNNMNAHPSVAVEFYDFFVSSYLCGFNSFEQANRWFSNHWDHIFAADYCIRVYHMRHIQVGNHQSIALMSDVVTKDGEEDFLKFDDYMSFESYFLGELAKKFA